MKKNNLKWVLIGAFLMSFSVQAQNSPTPKQGNWTLQECVSYALENNISIKQSELDIEAADVDKKSAFGNFLPSVNGSASHSWNIGLNQNITTGLLENQTTQFTSAGLNVGVDIYKGLQNQNNLRKANLSRVASQYQLQKMQEDISLNVANAYLQILFNKENLKVQREQFALDTKQLERTTELVEAGSVPRADLLDIKATLASDQQKVVAAENAVLISKLSLAQLLQIKDFQNFDIVDAEYEFEDSVLLLKEPKEIVDKAKENRVELKIAKTNLEIAEKNIAIARGAYQPTLQGFYSFSTRASNLDRVIGVQATGTNTTIGVVEGTGQNVLQPNFMALTGKASPVFEQFSDNKGQNFGLQLNVPIFNGFAARNNVARSKIALQRTKNTYDQQELDLERNVYTAFTDAKGALNAYQAALSALDAREQSFELATERLNVGMMTAFDYNQAQTLFVNAQSEVLRTKYDYIFKTKILELYFGIPIFQKL
jgi:outer membrane protein